MPIAFQALAPAAATDPETDLLVIGARSDRLDVDLAGFDRAALDAQGFKGETGQAQFINRATDGGGAPLHLIVGLGRAGDVGLAALRRAGTATARTARRCRHLTIDLLGAVAASASGDRAAAQALVEGLALGAYRYDHYRTEDTSANSIEAVAVLGRGGRRLQAAMDKGASIAGAVILARDLVNEPGGSLTAPVLAERAVAVAEAAGLAVTVLDEKAIAEQGMGGLLGVSRGSQQPPRFVELAWEPARPRGFVALVGKGITFDSGGLSIKTADGMASMKSDMGGAAAILAAMSVVPTFAPRTRVRAYLPLTDNMLGPDATRVGDVLTMRGGKTVEVLNTDAEGRLVLGDALAKATEDGPDAIVDLATLTGACEVALGLRTAGLMGTHDGLVTMVREAADATGEAVWPLPMPAHLRRQLDSDIADLRNIGTGRYGGALIAAHFLAEFVGDDIPWAHLDIAGPAWSEEDGDVPKGGTGFGVRLLVHLLSNWKRPPGPGPSAS
ncbi:MAG: leucyl aminopeptidase [Acidimicrobiales bacterium]